MLCNGVHPLRPAAAAPAQDHDSAFHPGRGRPRRLRRLIGRSARTVRRQLAQIAGHGLIVTGQTRGGVRWVALTRAAVLPSRWRPPEPLRLHLAARACRSPAAAAQLARAEAYLRDALLAEATMTGRAPPLLVAVTGGRLLA